ncbi:hypothetical protein HY628_02470 [Candidatus Uhrbacteria bacterium]|nr:hypothetical protein [Candidatus Uhrbacteria bacterium]
MKRYIFFLVIILFPATGWAAEFYFGVPSQEIPTESLFEAGVFLNTENERINAIQGSVLIPETFVFKEIRDGGSIVNFGFRVRPGRLTGACPLPA